MISGNAAPGSLLSLDLPQRSLRGQVMDDPARWLGDLGWQTEVASLANGARLAHCGAHSG